MSHPADGAPSPIDPDFDALLARSGLAPLRLGGRELLPIVQGGMGVGISAHRLAGSVAALGGIGTLSSVDLRRHHPDQRDRPGRVHSSDAVPARHTRDSRCRSGSASDATPDRRHPTVRATLRSAVMGAIA